MPVTIGGKPQAGFQDPFGLLSDCHRRIETFLGALVKAAALGRQRALTADEREALWRAVEYFRTSAPRHTADEELSVFPRLRVKDEAAEARRAIEGLEKDHTRAAALHKAVDALASRLAATGALLLTESDALAAALGELDALYRRHIEIEDSQVFPAARQALGADELEAIGREMADRRR